MTGSALQVLDVSIEFFVSFLKKGERVRERGWPGVGGIGGWQIYVEVCWALCWLHVAPCGLMLRPSWLHVGSSWVKVGRVGSMLAQDASKLAPRWLKMAICWLNLASRRPKWLPESSKMPQKCLGKASR